MPANLRDGVSRRRRVAAVAGTVAVAGIVVAGAMGVAAWKGDPPSTSIEITIRYSHFEPAEITVPVGVPVTITLVNTDPIDHEWIVGDESVHAVHRVSAEPLHPTRPTEVVLPAGETRTTTITFDSTGSLRFICHLPLHEQYGMAGTVTIR